MNLMCAGEGDGGEDAAEADDLEGVQGGDRGPPRRQRRHAIEAKDHGDGGGGGGENGYETETSLGQGLDTITWCRLCREYLKRIVLGCVIRPPDYLWQRRHVYTTKDMP